MSDKTSTILIVDDDKTVIDQLVSHFRMRNCEPIATTNPTFVEETLRAFEVHLILLDLRMERLSGYDVLKKLREKNVQVPILIITAYYQDEKDKLAQFGFTQEDVIEKPFSDFSKIEARINKKLSKTVVPGEYGSPYENRVYLNNKTKLVVVEDYVEINDMFKEIFGSRNYEVKVFERGKEALDYILENECHVVLVDMLLPDLNGEQIIKQALARKPSLKFIPMTGADITDMKKMLAEAGFNPDLLVTKPYDIPRLVEQIKVLAEEVGTLGC